MPFIFNRRTDSGLVAAYRWDTTFAVNPDGSGGVPSNGGSFGFLGDGSPTAANSTKTGAGISLPVYRANQWGTKPGVDFSGGSDINVAAWLSLGSPSALNTADGSTNYTVLIAGTYKASANPFQFAFAREGRFCHGVLGNTPMLAGAPDYGAYGNYTALSDRGTLSADSAFVTFGTSWDASTAECSAVGGVQRIYVNDLAKKAANGASSASPGTPIAIGAIATNGAYPWKGLIAEVGVYNRTLAPWEVWLWGQQVRADFGLSHPLTSAPYGLAWDGDSISGTAGLGYLVESTEALLGISPDLVANLAWGGKTTTAMSSRAPTDVDPFLSVLPAGPKKIQVFMEGANELGFGAAAVSSHLETYGTARVAAGWPWVVAATVLPYQAVGTVSEPASLTLRTDFAAHVPYCNALADVASDSVMGNPANGTNTTYYRDEVHPTIAGDGLLAPYFVAGIQAGLPDTGSGSPTLPRVTASGSGTVSTTGSGAATLGRVEASGEGDTVPSGLIREAVFAALSADPTIASVVGTKITPVAPREKASPPSLQYQLVSNAPVWTLDGPLGKSLATFRFTARSKAQADCQAAGEAIRNMLDGFNSIQKGLLGGVCWVDWARKQPESDDRDVAADGSDLGTFKTAVEYVIRYRELKP